MDYTLTIDQGNTSSKATVFQRDEVVETYRYVSLSVEELCPLFEKYDFQGVAYCSVTRLDAKLVESLRHMTEAPVVVLTHETPLPIEICYKSPQTLGLDRVAAAVGAVARCPEKSVLVVDAGTALTIDVVDNKARFKGGNISPGMSLRFKSLHEFTDALPLVAVCENDELQDFGYDTPTAIRFGVVNGIVAEIIAAYESACKSYGCSGVLITGGDASCLASKILSHGIAVEQVRNLVAEGLNRILRYNENI